MKEKVCTNRYGRRDARICLWKDGKGKTYLVARLVAMTFCAGYQPNMTVNHINGNSLDNRVVNLEWCTRSENIKDAFQTGLYSSIQKKVVLVDVKSSYSKEFDSQAEASAFLGRNHAYVNNCIRKNRVAVSSDGTEYIIC
jgi:hypothetical protein